MPTLDTLGLDALGFVAVTGPVLATAAVLLGVFGLISGMATRTLRGMERMHYDPDSDEYRASARLLGWSSTVRSSGPALILGLASLEWLPGALGVTVAALCGLETLRSVATYAPYRSFGKVPLRSPAIAVGAEQ